MKKSLQIIFSLSVLLSTAGSYGIQCIQLLAPGAGQSYVQYTDFEDYIGENKRKPLIYDFTTVSNEHRHDLFQKVIKNGGGFLGVGGEINLIQIAMSRASEAWIYDVDPRVLGVHKLIEIAMDSSATIHEFLKFFKDLEDLEVTETQSIELNKQLSDQNLKKALLQLAISSPVCFNGWPQRPSSQTSNFQTCTPLIVMGNFLKHFIAGPV